MDNNELGKAIVEELAKQFPEDTFTFISAEEDKDFGGLHVEFEADTSVKVEGCTWTCSKHEEPEYSEATDENLSDDFSYSEIEEFVAEKYTNGLAKCKDELDKLLPDSEFTVDIADCDSFDVVESEAEDWDLMDDGNGWTEFWGVWSNDTHEYWEVTGPAIFEVKKVSGHIYIMPKTV